MHEVLISFGQNIFVTNKENGLTEISVIDALDYIKSDKLKIHTDYLRQEKDKEKRGYYKNKFLPFVTFNGSFNNRSIDGLKKASGYMVLDYDKTYNEDETQRIREKLENDNKVFSVFSSPSGALKFLVKIPIVDTDEEFKEYYSYVKSYFEDKGIELDESGKDICRLCFLSHDKKIYINKESEIIREKLENQKIPQTEKITELEEIDRSKIEYQEVCRLISKGKDKKEVFSHMQSFEKWKSKPESYKELTYNKALSFCSNNKKGKQKEEENIIYKSCLETKTHLYEQVYNENEIYFLGYEFATGTIQRYDEVEHNNLIYKPISDEEVINNQIKLPSEVEEYNTDEELDKQIEKFIHKWLDIPEDIKKYSVFNIRKSWVFEKFHTLNYLRALGEHGTGKSRFLDTLGLIHYKPIATSGALTSAVLFRLINKWGGTLIIDEADRSNSDESDDVIKIINQGYEKGKPVIRCNQENNNKLQFFDVYCPKIIGTRRQFEDKATESRCITHNMRETNRKDIPLTLNSVFDEESKKIRNMLLLWRFRNYNKIDTTAGDIIQEWDLEPRLKQVNKSFLCMFAHDEKEVQRFKTWLTNYQQELVDVRSSSVEGRIIHAIYDMEQEKIPITASNIIDKAHLVTKKGEAWQPRALSNVMKQLSFANAEQKKINGVNYKIYEFDEDFINKLYRKYIPKNEILGNRVTEVTLVTETPTQAQKTENSVNLQKVSNSVTSVTSVTRLPFEKVKKCTKNEVFSLIKSHNNLINTNKIYESLGFEFKDSIDFLLNKLKEEGDIFSPKNDFWSVL